MNKKERLWAEQWEALFGALAVKESPDEAQERSRTGAEKRSFDRQVGDLEQARLLNAPSKDALVFRLHELNSDRDRFPGGEAKGKFSLLLTKAGSQIRSDQLEDAAQALDEAAVLAKSLPPRPPEKARQLRQQAWADATKEWKRDIDLANYQVDKQVGGAGGMGEIRFMKPAGGKSGPDLVFKTSKSSKALDEMRHEAKYYDKVGPHPNIARCLGVQKVGNDEGLVLEKVTGGDMSKAIMDMNALFESGELSQEAYFGMVQFNAARVIDALAHMEKQGVIHRDIKSPNVMIDGDTGEPKIIDFGVSTDTGVARSAGTMGHIPKKTGTTGKDDLFAVGGMLYEVLLGNTGLTGANLFQYDYVDPEGSSDDSKRIHALEVAPEVAREGMKNVQGGKAPCPKCGQPLDLKADKCPACGYEKAFRAAAGGKLEKRKGKYAANTDYVDFVNRLMHPDESRRMTFAQALDHPFLKNRMLDDDQAREQFKTLVARRGAPPTDAAKVSFATVSGLSESAWTTTYQNAIDAKGVPAADGLAQTIREQLQRFEAQWAVSADPSAKAESQSAAAEGAREALSEVARAVGNLEKKRAYSANTCMGRYLAALRADATGRMKRLDCARQFGDVAGFLGDKEAGDAAEQLGPQSLSLANAWDAFQKAEAWLERETAANDAIQAATGVLDALQRLEKQASVCEAFASFVAAARQDAVPKKKQMETYVLAGQYQIDFTVVDGFNPDAWEQTYENAMQANALPPAQDEKRGLYDQIRSYRFQFERFIDPHKLSPNIDPKKLKVKPLGTTDAWKKRQKHGQDAITALTNVRAAVQRLLNIPPYAKHAKMSQLLRQYDRMANGELTRIQPELDTMNKIGAPQDLDVAALAGAWIQAKSQAETELKAALPRVKFSRVIEFKGDLRSSLKSLAKSWAGKKQTDTKRGIETVRETAVKYVTLVQDAKREFLQQHPGAGTDFFIPLIKALDDILRGVDQLAKKVAKDDWT